MYNRLHSQTEILGCVKNEGLLREPLVRQGAKLPPRRVHIALLAPRGLCSAGYAGALT